MTEQEDLYLDYLDISDEDRAYIQAKVDAVRGMLMELDERVNAVADKWKTERMTKVDLTIIRLAAYEILFDEDVPTGVAINEAVELAKRYGTDQSAAFVNAVLAKMA
jgi:N utilization substance protein B